MTEKELQLEDTVSADRKERIIYVGPGKTRKISSITSRQNFNNEKFTRKANKGEGEDDQDDQDDQEDVKESAIQPTGTTQIENGAPTQSDTINKSKKPKSNSPQIEFVTGTQQAGSSSTAIGNAQNMGIKKISEALVQKAIKQVKADDEWDDKNPPFEPDTKAEKEFKKPHNPNRSPMDTVRALAQKAMQKQTVKEESALDKVRARTGFDPAASNRRREEKAEHEHNMKIARDEHEHNMKIAKDEHNHAHNVAWDKESERARKERNDSHRQQSDKVTDAMIGMTKKKFGEEVENIDERIIMDKDGNKIGGGTYADRLKDKPAFNPQHFRDRMNTAGNRTAGDPFKKEYKKPEPKLKPGMTVKGSTNEEVETIDEKTADTSKNKWVLGTKSDPHKTKPRASHTDDGVPALVGGFPQGESEEQKPHDRNATMKNTHKAKWSGAEHDKKMDEEVEQIDELSVGALKSYINKANPEVKAAKAERQSAREGGDLQTADSARRTADRRTAGIKQAKAKLNKEGTEMKTYQEFLDQLLEYTPGPGGVTRVQGRSYGAQYHDPEGDDDADDKAPAAKAAATLVLPEAIKSLYSF